MIEKLSGHLKQEISIAPLVIFRLVWAFMLLVSVIRFAWNGWIKTMYIDPQFYFPFISGVEPLPGAGMYVVFILMGLAALGMLLGYFYRLSAVLFFLLFTYVELLDKTNYLNHYYFVSLVCFLLIFLPAHRAFSLDVRLRKIAEISHIPFWQVAVLRLQLGIVYFFAGLAKFTYDWLFLAQPLKIWLASKTSLPILGPLLKFKITAYFFSWFGMIYDLSIAFFLSSRRSLPWAYAAVVVFHLMTWFLFPIGMFPFIMIAATTVFFPVAVHERILGKLQAFFGKSRVEVKFSKVPSYRLAVFLSVFLFIQILLPLRAYCYPGDLFWNEQGYRFSWRVMLMEKSGAIHFQIAEGNKKEWVDNREFLTPQQEKMMATQPDMIIQFARFLKQTYQQRGFENPVVTAESYVSLNGRPSRRFVNEKVNLAEQDYFPTTNWIVQYD